jgi:exopolysaccharide biosynthesis WecB/TagA/CpsF family protein
MMQAHSMPTTLNRMLYLAMPYDQGKSGISAYIRATLKELSGRRNLTLIALKSDLPALQACLQPGDHRIVALANFWGNPLASLLWFLLLLPRLVKAPDISQVFVPAGNRRCLINASKPVVTTVHDLAPLRLERKYDPLRQFYLSRILPWLLARAGKLVAISNSTATDLTELAGIPATEITLAPNGYESQRFHAQPQADDSEVLVRHGLQADLAHPYLLYVARIEHPGKNHLGLLQAWQLLPEDLRSQHTLVLAGSDWKSAEVVHAWVNEHQPQNVKFLGFVPDQDLPALYRHASLYVQPSLYEGFGIPLVEAMASGVAVLSSNCGALPEVGGQAVQLVEPTPQAMAIAIERLLQRPELRRQMAQAGLKRAQQFSWERHAQVIAELAQPSEKVVLQGLALFNGPMSQVLDTITARIQARQQTRLYYVNADCLNLAWHDSTYRQALQQADLLLPDGSGVSLGAKLTGQKLVENLNGTDMFLPLCEMAQAQGLKVWFLGGKPEVNPALVAQVQARWPKLQIVGAHHGFIRPEQEKSLLQQIRNDAPDILFVAMGAPRQELWIQTHAETLQIPLMLGVGGLFDFYSGRIPRAPILLRRLGLEWCWRLLQEPTRLWQRYLIGNPLFVLRMLRAGKQAPRFS